MFPRTSSTSLTPSERKGQLITVENGDPPVELFNIFLLLPASLAESFLICNQFYLSDISLDIKYRVWEPPCHLLFLLYYKKILRVLFIRVLLMFRFVDTLDEYHYIIPLNILIICTNDIYFMYTYFYYLVFLNTYNTISKIFHNYEMNL